MPLDPVTSVRAFDPYRRAHSSKLKSLVAQAVAAVEQLEWQSGSRKRRRRQSAQPIFEQTVEALICDAAHARISLGMPNLSLYLSRNVQKYPARYRSSIETRAFGEIASALHQLSWIELKKGVNPKYISLDEPDRPTMATQTNFWAGSKLIRYAETTPLTFADFRRDKGGETIVLKRSKQDYWDVGGRIDYAETDSTKVMREQMQALNSWLGALDIECSLGGIDSRDRHLKRYFNNSRFDQGGRVFGGFWQPMSSADRNEHIRINGRRVTTLDYPNMFPRMLYAIVGAAPPEGDLYDIPEAHSVPRAAIKRIFSSLIFGASANHLPKKMRSGVPAQFTMAAIVRALRSHHAPIAHLLPSNIGFELFYLESEIMLRVLERCRGASIGALPVHDAVVVADKHATSVRMIMEEEFSAGARIDPKFSPPVARPL